MMSEQLAPDALCTEKWADTRSGDELVLNADHRMGVPSWLRKFWRCKLPSELYHLVWWSTKNK